MTISPFRLAAMMTFLAVITFLASCTKEPMAPAAVNPVHGVTTDNIIIPMTCQLTSISANASYSWRQGIMGRIDYTNITYNSASLPARCKHSESSYDSLVSNFYYDASNRLKTITTNWYPKNHVFTYYQTDYYTFNYLANGTLLVGQYFLTAGNPTHQGVGALLIEFDASHRVVKQSRTIGATDGSGTLTGYLRYVYGRGGNLSDVYLWAMGDVEKPYYHFNTYDTKRGFCTTNSVWQLLLDQYSVNNPTNFIYYLIQPYNDLMVYQYSAQNEPTSVQHWDAVDGYWTSNPIGYSCKIIF